MRFVRLALAAVAPFLLAGIASCSDPVPPTTQGAWSISFQAPDTNPSQCAISGHNAGVGSVTADKRDNVIPDGPMDGGTSPATVECSVVGTGKFDVHGKMTQEDKGLEISIKGMTTDATEAAPIPGAAAYASTKTGGSPYASTAAMPCQFFFTPNTSEGVAAGRIWVSFKCPSVVDSGGMSTCQIKQGFAIFENCTQVATN